MAPETGSSGWFDSARRHGESPVIATLVIVAVLLALLLMLVTCIQVLYLEALRLRTRELPSLQYFKEKLEKEIGLSTERGVLTFSLVKHTGLAIFGCLVAGAAF